MSVPTQTAQQVCPPQIPSLSNLAQRNAMERNKKLVFWFGVIEIILGLISCVIGIETLRQHSFTRHPQSTYYLSYRPHKSYDNRVGDIGQGIWCGLFFIVCGVVGVSIRFKTTPRLYKVNLITGIFGAILMLTLTILSCISASAANARRDRFFVWYIILTLIGMAGVVIAIMHGVFSNVTKSNRYKPDGSVRYTAVPHLPQQAMIPVQMPNGQIIFYPPQPFYPVAMDPINAPTLPMTMPNANQIVFPTHSNFNATDSMNIPHSSNAPTPPVPVSSSLPPEENCSNSHTGQVVPPPIAQPVETSIRQPIQAQASPSPEAVSDRPPSYGNFYKKDY